MQIRIGKKKTLWRDKSCRGAAHWRWKLTQTGHGEIVSIFILAFFSSCSLLKTIDIKDRKRPLETSLRQVCLSSEGEGRVLLAKKKHSFEYESLLNLLDRKWSLALHIPLHGEEVLHLNWRESSKREGEKKSYGSFDEGGDFGKAFHKVFYYWKVFLKFYGEYENRGHTLANKCLVKKREKTVIRGVCQASSLGSDFPFSWEVKRDGLAIVFTEKEVEKAEETAEAIFKVKFFRLRGGAYFRRTQISLLGGLEVNLWADKCHSPPPPPPGV